MLVQTSILTSSKNHHNNQFFFVSDPPTLARAPVDRPQGTTCTKLSGFTAITWAQRVHLQHATISLGLTLLRKLRSSTAMVPHLGMVLDSRTCSPWCRSSESKMSHLCFEIFFPHGPLRGSDLPRFTERPANGVVSVAISASPQMKRHEPPRIGEPPRVQMDFSLPLPREIWGDS